MSTPAVTFSATPSLDAPVAVSVSGAAPDGAVIGSFVATTGAVPGDLGIDRTELAAAGFDAEIGAALLLPPSNGGPARVAVGAGDAGLDAARVRDAAAAFARAADRYERLALVLPETVDGRRAAARAAVEAVLLTRYRYDPLRTEPEMPPLRELTLVTGDEPEAARAGAERGRTCASAAMLARDLANTPHSHLTASDLADIAIRLGERNGFTVEVFDETALAEMRCGGILAVNAGSAEPPRMIKLGYRPEGAHSGRLALVGKGIMFDSGGISLKPSDATHALMKTDMTGAGDILAAFTTLRELGCRTAVTGYLMCTDNMPSATATVLGDVITMRDGSTVEVLDTDAEGRLVMADALVLAGEDGHDAVVDIATLTGSVVRALGPEIAGLFGTSPELVAQVEAAAEVTGEMVWQLPMHPPYRKLIDSEVADRMNCAPIGHPDALISALFLAEFAGDLPWAHIDIAGTAHTTTARAWYPRGCTGFGTRLLIELAIGFTPPAGTGARPARPTTDGESEGGR